MSSSDSNANRSPWFHDTRFHFGGRQQLQNSLNQAIGEINGAVGENPALVGQIRQQLELVSDLLRQIPGSSQQPPPVLPEQPPLPPGNGHQHRPASSSVIVNMTHDTTLNNHNQRRQSDDSELPIDAPNLELEPVDGGDGGVVGNDDETENENPPAAGTDDAAGGPEARTVNNEVRRISELLRSPEIQRVIWVLVRILPVLLIFITKLVVDHFSDIAIVIISLICFFPADADLQKSVFSRGSGQLALIKALIILCVWFGVVFFYFGDGIISSLLTFQIPPALIAGGFCSTIGAVILTDFFLKFTGMLIKITVSFVPSGCLVQKRKRRFYQWIEYSSQLYRYWVPVLPWFHFLSTSHQSKWGVSDFCCLTLAICYCFYKLITCKSSVVNWYHSSRYLFRLKAVGTRPSVFDMGKANNSCVICFGDYTDPTKLCCGHIFCEDCITTWLDKESTCPMCRKEVLKEGNEWKSGATSWAVQVF